MLPSVGRFRRTSKSSGFSALAMLLTALSDKFQSGTWDSTYTKARRGISFCRRTCAGNGLRMKSTRFSNLAAFCLGLSAAKELVEDHSAFVLVYIALACTEHSPQEERIGIFLIDLIIQPLEPFAQARGI